MCITPCEALQLKHDCCTATAFQTQSPLHQSVSTRVINTTYNVSTHVTNTFQTSARDACFPRRGVCWFKTVCGARHWLFQSKFRPTYPTRTPGTCLVQPGSKQTPTSLGSMRVSARRNQQSPVRFKQMTAVSTADPTPYQHVSTRGISSVSNELSVCVAVQHS